MYTRVAVDAAATSVTFSTHTAYFFGLKPVEDLICARQNRFVTRYISTANSLYGLISRNIVDHVSVLVIAAYLLSQPYYMC